MCGIFGVLTTKDSPLTRASLRTTVDHLFRLSESRGKEAAGISLLSGDTIRVYKEAVPASTLIRRQAYRRLFNDALVDEASTAGDRIGRAVAVIGHSRLVTNGSQACADNNQPVLADGMVAVHNGIIVNEADLWDRHPTLHRRGDVDTEILLRLIRKFERSEHSLIKATQAAFRHIKGSASIAILFEDLDYVLLASNTGSLYACMNRAGNTCVFASERSILRRLTAVRRVRAVLGDSSITRLSAGTGWLVRVGDLTRHAFTLNSDDTNGEPIRGDRRVMRRIVDASNGVTRKPSSPVEVRALRPARVEGIRCPEDADERSIRSLRRCARCILPETMPFITFDAQGVCNYCHQYRPLVARGLSALEAAVAPYRNRSGEPDCLLGLSGGRDSSYALHFVKTVLKMNPITYTYDWGMVTDLARRNISRLCGAMGVENILVSANIARKRSNIRKNVQAWLRRPVLGMVPLFMAGDKQWLFHAGKVSRQTGVKLVVMGVNPLELTNFKTGFAGVAPHSGDYTHRFGISAAARARLAVYYARHFLRNPAYLNASLGDTLGAFASYFVLPRTYLNLYDYIRWDEGGTDVLQKQYGWEGAPDTSTTWRVGDGTAAFYNYIYYTVAGFSEHDTFRSNQIREGRITRDDALVRVREENAPRYETIRSYCRTVGLDYERTLEVIRRIPRLYAASPPAN